MSICDVGVNYDNRVDDCVITNYTSILGEEERRFITLGEAWECEQVKGVNEVRPIIVIDQHRYC